MGDISNWKNKNRNILKGAIEGVKKIAAPFIKEAVGLEEVKSLLKGAGKAMSIEKQKKYIKPFTKKHKKAEKILKGEN